MRMIFVCLALFNVAVAQNVTTVDFHGRYSLKTGELFTLRDHWAPPDMGKSVRDKAAYIADSTLKPIASIKVDYAFAFETVNKNRQIAFSASCRIESAGTYKFVREISYNGSDGTKYNLKQYWILEVSSPILEPKLDQYFFPHETAYFNFAAGHSNHDKYSFEIYDQNNMAAPVYRARGSVIQLDSLTYRSDVLAFNEPNHRYILKGLYDGVQFKFKKNAADSSAPVLSEWIITVKKPKLEELHTWLPAEAFDDTTRGDVYRLRRSLNLHSDAFANLCQFRYVYFSQKGTTYIYTPMNISKIEVVSNNPILESSKTYRSVSQNFYKLIEITRDDTADLPKEGVEVTLKISFRTQYEQVQKTYKAIVW